MLLDAVVSIAPEQLDMHFVFFWQRKSLGDESADLLPVEGRKGKGKEQAGTGALFLSRVDGGPPLSHE